MKTPLLFSLLSLFIFQISFAQQWPNEGAEWTYCTSSSNELEIPLTAASIKFFYTRDTLVDDVLYNVVENEEFSEDARYRYYTRYSNDTVYRWVNNQEYLYFHFDLVLDEVITTFRSIEGTSDTSCSSVLPLRVIDVTTITISGEELTQWTLRDTLGFDPDDSGSPSYPEFVLIERIGFADLNRFYNPEEALFCSVFPYESVNYLDGYKDDDFTEWVSDCPTAKVPESDLDFFSIHPNPLNSYQQQLTVELKSNHEKLYLELTDLTGKSLYTVLLTENKTLIDLSLLNVSQGLYFVNLVEENGMLRKSEKLLIK